MNRVLVVDDDASILRMSSLVLAMAGYEVLSATNGLEALAVIEAHQPSVVVLDLQMPVMDGRTTFANILAAPYIPLVIICSAYGAQKACEELGAHGALDKPFDPQLLVDMVDALSGLRDSPAFASV